MDGPWWWLRMMEHRILFPLWKTESKKVHYVQSSAPCLRMWRQKYKVKKKSQKGKEKTIRSIKSSNKFLLSRVTAEDFCLPQVLNCLPELANQGLEWNTGITDWHHSSLDGCATAVTCSLNLFILFPHLALEFDCWETGRVNFNVNIMTPMNTDW